MNSWDDMWRKPFDDGAHYATRHLVQGAVSHKTQADEAERVMVVRLLLPPGAPGIRALRLALKAMLRRLGLKCIGLREERI